MENFHRFNPLKHSTSLTKAFTENGLYMLATIFRANLYKLMRYLVLAFTLKILLSSCNFQGKIVVTIQVLFSRMRESRVFGLFLVPAVKPRDDGLKQAEG